MPQALSEPHSSIAQLGQVVLVFQGGGALGAYQAGVYQALHEAGIEPDWIIGTSIGAINASLIAGNTIENRLPRLKAFWHRVEQDPSLDWMSMWPGLGRSLPNFQTILQGIKNFFEPNPLAAFGSRTPMTPETAAYYSTKPLEKTLTDLVDFEFLRLNSPRLTVGTAAVTTSEMTYFDSQTTTLTAKHIMASGALPPAFPAVRIDGSLYWDGGILSNTPVEAVFDDKPRRNSLVISVHIWNPNGPEPSTIWDVMNRQKDIQYSSRTDSHIMRQQQIHRLRHIIAELGAKLPDAELANPDVREMVSYGCLTRMHVVRLLAPTLKNEDHTKDIDFSHDGIHQRWSAGYRDTQNLLLQKPWENETNPLDGFFLHEVRGKSLDSSEHQMIAR